MNLGEAANELKDAQENYNGAMSALKAQVAGLEVLISFLQEGEFSLTTTNELKNKAGKFITIPRGQYLYEAIKDYDDGRKRLKEAIEEFGKSGVKESSFRVKPFKELFIKTSNGKED